MVLRKTWVSENVGLISKSQKRVLVVLEVSFSVDFEPQSLEF